MNTEQHDIVLTRLMNRRQRGGAPVLERKAQELTTAALTKTMVVQGWNLTYEGHEERELDVTERTGADVWHYSMKLRLSFAHQVNQPNSNMYLALVRTIGKLAGSVKYGGWNIASVDGDEYEELDETDAPLAKDFVGYATVELPPDAEFSQHFSHLYGVENQLGMLKSKLDASIDADWNSRYHTLLVGPPGCGKSDMAHTLKQMLGDDAVLEFDGTALTAAGVIDVLKDLPILPRVVIIEEAEKITSEQVSSVFLALMDQRGEIRKTTARQSIQRDTKLFCIATCNNYKRLQKLNAGAFASRFGKPIHFNRPTRAMMEKILEREITKVDGNLAWINPCVDYIEKHKIEDTREIIDLCMCGRDMWLDATDDEPSTYEKMLDATGPAAVSTDAEDELASYNGQEDFDELMLKFIQKRMAEASAD